MRPIRAGLVIAAIAVAPLLTAIFARGTGGRVIANTATVVELHCTDGELMAYAEARVYSPEMPDVPFVNGRADRRGRVTFAADRDGIWHIEAQDNEGHKVRTDVTLAAGAAVPQRAAGGNSRFLRASLFVNVFAVASLIEALRGKRTPVRSESADKLMEGASI